jgi:nitrite reductase/ring-hydroxylating ferredoxin subunit/uncharacterized membrane protein
MAANSPNPAPDRFDTLTISVRERVQRALPGGPVKDVLSGTWLGHALHPMLTDLPIGFWTAGCLLDVCGGRRGRDAARTLIGIGVLSAVPTALSGAADWSDTTGRASRLGLGHAVANATATGCFAASWWSRRRGHHTRGVALGALGAVAATVGGWMGGHLVGRYGLGVDQTTFQDTPDGWTTVASLGALDGGPVRVRAGEAPLVLLRRQDTTAREVVCLGATCPHRGAPMEGGEVIGDTIVCPWHGSRFRIADGSVAQGPALAPLPRYECRVTDDVVAVGRRLGPR